MYPQESAGREDEGGRGFRRARRASYLSGLGNRIRRRVLGVAPAEVYELGGAYIVVEDNHRDSVAVDAVVAEFV
jgi:hypothetical protein